jgi:hypothetical protein
MPWHSETYQEDNSLLKGIIDEINFFDNKSTLTVIMIT